MMKISMIGPLGVLLAVFVSIGAGSAIIGKPQQQQSTVEQANELVSDSSNNNGGGLPLAGASENQYRANYYYVPAAVGTAKTVQNGNRNIDWNRDSYSDAASEYGYNLDSAQTYGVPHQGYQAQYGASSHNTPAFFSNNNDGDDGLFDLDGVGTSLSSITGGLGGLGGLLGLKGLKGLGLLGLFKLGWPLLLFLGLPLLLLAPLLLLFLPIPIITIPTNPNGRTFGPFRFADFSTKMTNLARSVLESDKCIERISCEISRISRGSFIDKAVTRAIQRFELQMPNSLKRMARAYLEPSSCRRYTCSILASSSDDSFKAKKKST